MKKKLFFTLILLIPCIIFAENTNYIKQYELVEDFNNSNYKIIDSDVKALLNETNNVIEIYIDTIKEFEYNYTEEYILKDYSNIEITKDILKKSETESKVQMYLLTSMLNLSEIKNKNIESLNPFKELDYDKYGISIKSKDYELDLFSTTFNYYYKLSLDKDKIKQLNNITIVTNTEIIEKENNDFNLTLYIITGVCTAIILYVSYILFLMKPKAKNKK